MASGQSGGENAILPLWRIHHLSDKGAGDTVSIVNIARPDSLALLTELSGGHGPAWANEKLALAVDYEAELQSLRYATLVRVQEVTVAQKPGTYSATLRVLCQTRVTEVSERSSFPTARRAPALAPLWRIHNLGMVGEASFISSQINYEIRNIGRQDTVALLEHLGGGNAVHSVGHLVLACDYKAEVKVGLRALLVRIRAVKSDDEAAAAAASAPRYKATLDFLGHVRCADVSMRGAFPECRLDDVPVWMIHGLDKNAGQRQHSIINIARPDSVALLKHIGGGHALEAQGGLVIGCDYKSPPRSGESARLMRVTSISPSKGEGLFEAVLVDVSTVAVARLRTAQSEGQAETWWPRVPAVLPEVWNTAKKGGAAQDVGPAIKSSVTCPYWERCHHALICMFRDVRGSMSRSGPGSREVGTDKCFCGTCFRRRGDRVVALRAHLPEIKPLGYARVGIVRQAHEERVKVSLDNFHVCYHGTGYNHLPEILMMGMLLHPGCTLLNGEILPLPEGHIDVAHNRRNEHTGKEEHFSPMDKLFFSPSVKYCELYASIFPCDGNNYQFLFEIRLQPNTFEIGQETVGLKAPVDPHVPNSSIEWYTPQQHTHIITGILVKEV